MGNNITASGSGTFAIGLSDQSGLNVSANNVMSIMGGSVGIGTPAPVVPLHVYSSLAYGVGPKALTVTNVASPSTGAGAGGMLVDWNGGGGVYMSDSTAGIHGKYEVYGGVLGIGTISTHQMQFSTANVQRVAISTSGNVGIAEMSPTYLLHLEKSSTSTSDSTFPTIHVANRSAATNSFSAVEVSGQNGTVQGGMLADGLGTSATAIADTLAGLNSQSYGVHFSSNQVIIFEGTTYDERASSNEIINLDSRSSISTISLSGGGSDIYFNRIYGKPNKTATLTISVGSFTKNVSVGALGNISID
jgi:hypothetical protein